MKKIVAGNWKMHGSLVSNAKLLSGMTDVPGVEVVLCVPYPYLEQLRQRPAGLALGAQDVSEYAQGAYTGDGGDGAGGRGVVSSEQIAHCQTLVILLTK